MGSCELLLDVFQRHAQQRPTELLYTFCDDSGNDVAHLTLQDLERSTRAIARALLADRAHGGWGVARGDTVLLVYPPSLDFIVAFLACLRAGVIAVPVYPPDPRSAKKNLDAFVSVQRMSNATVALTSADYNWAKRVATLKPRFLSSRAGSANWPDLRWIVTTSGVPAPPADAALDAALDRATSRDVAFLQFTSGSTADPKGVMITHGNLAHNLTTIITALRAGPDTVVVSWLPQYHDMGLIGSHLGTLYCGGRGYYVSPLSFLRSPVLWLQLVTKHRGTHLQAPNFAYKLVARKYKALRKPPALELSSVRHSFNAAEPIDPAAARAFLETFQPLGFRPDAMVPGYGLAEHTVYVCDGGQLLLKVARAALEDAGEVEVLASSSLIDADEAFLATDNSVSLCVGCGRAPDSAGVRLLIVDPATREELPPLRVGEIWLDSPSKAVGYWQQPELSAAAFEAALASAPDSGRFLRTGDLGFVHEGELFVCGRSKDLIIIRGRNHFPQDMERTVEEDEALRPGCSAAFSFPSGGEEALGVVAEVREPRTVDVESVVRRMRSALAAAHGVQLAAAVLLRPHTVPKTTSGKISRHRCRSAFLQCKLEEPLHQWRLPAVPSEDVEDGAEGGSAVAAAAADDAAAAAAAYACGEAEANDAATAAESGAPVADEQLPLPAGMDVRRELVRDVARLLHVPAEEVSESEPLPTLGMDSMAMTQLRGLLHDKYGAVVPDEELYAEDVTLARLAELVEQARTSGGSELAPAQPDAEAGPATPVRAVPPPAAAEPAVRRPPPLQMEPESPAAGAPRRRRRSLWARFCPCCPR